MTRRLRLPVASLPADTVRYTDELGTVHVVHRPALPAGWVAAAVAALVSACSVAHRDPKPDSAHTRIDVDPSGAELRLALLLPDGGVTKDAGQDVPGATSTAAWELPDGALLWAPLRVLNCAVEVGPLDPQCHVPSYFRHEDGGCESVFPPFAPMPCRGELVGPAPTEEELVAAREAGAP